jgi:hypothetical protein
LQLFFSLHVKSIAWRSAPNHLFALTSALTFQTTTNQR